MRRVLVHVSPLSRFARACGVVNVSPLSRFARACGLGECRGGCGVALLLLAGCGPSGAQPAPSGAADAGFEASAAGADASSTGADASDPDPDPVITAAERVALEALSPAMLPAAPP